MTKFTGQLKSKSAPSSWIGFKVEIGYPLSVQLQQPEPPAQAPNAGRTVEEQLAAREAAAKASGKTAGKAAAKGNTPKGETATVWHEITVAVGDTGGFTVELDDIGAGDVRAVAFGRSGERLAEKSVDQAQLAKTVDIDIEVDLSAGVALAKQARPFEQSLPRISGRVISAQGTEWLAGRAVTILGVPQAGGAAVALAAARIDSGGTFGADYPIEVGADRLVTPPVLASAYALVEGATAADDKPEIAIPVTTIGTVASVLPQAITLIVKQAGDDDVGEGTTRPAAVPRTPDMATLVNSEDFSEDLGTAGCIKLSTPNRSLEEFSFYTAVRTTDPEIIAQGQPTVDTSGVMISPHLRMISTVSPALIGRKRSRAPLSASNSINWDSVDIDEPALFEATTVAHGHLLQFKQVWRADGYSLGDLLYSLPLAPGQKKQIAIVDWERREAASRSEETSFSENLDSLLARDRDISDIIRTTLKEHSHGESDALTIGSAHGSGASAGGSSGPVSFGGLAATSMSGGYSQSSATQDSARDLVASAIQRIHDQTLQASSAVRTLRTSVIQTVSQGERVSATTEVVANHNHCHALTIEYFEVLRHFKITTELASVRECLYVPLPITPFSAEKVRRWRDLLEPFLMKKALLPGFDANDRAIDQWKDADFPLGSFADEPIHSVQGSLILVVRAPRQNPSATDTAQALVDAAGEYLPDVVEKINKVVLGILGTATSGAPSLVSPSLAMRFVYRSGAPVNVNMQFTLLDEFAPNKALRVRARSTSPVGSALSRADLEYATISWLASATSGLPEGCDLILQSATMYYRTAHLDHVLFDDPNAGAGLAKDAAFFDTTVLSAQERRRPRDEDLTGQRKLRNHLNQNIEYYHKAIWWTMDSDRRFMLLDGYLAPAPAGQAQRSLAAVVENRIIGFAGNSMVMPVGHGIHLDPSYAIDPNNPAALTDLYPPTYLPPSRVSLPTKGVFAEAIMGECNSCEKKDETLFWRWTEAPTGDEPVSITPPSTEGRRSDTPNLTPSAFPTAVVGIQTAPTLPEPTGLAAALKLLGTADLFTDLTGLEGNQKNAATALQANADAVKVLAQEASKLAQQKQMSSGGVEKALESIKDAEKAGLIDKKQSSDLTVEAIKGLIAGEKKTTASDKAPIKDLIDSATAAPKSKVSYESGGERVEVEKTPLVNASYETFAPAAKLGVLGTSKSKITGKVVTVRLLGFPGDSAVMFKTGMALDVDGSPRAYHPDSAKGLDKLANACSYYKDASHCYLGTVPPGSKDGKPAHWTGVVVKTNDHTQPIEQSATDPAPGFYVSQTALRDKSKKLKDPTAYVDAMAIPYVALPSTHPVLVKAGIKMGDFAVVHHTGTGELVGAIFADHKGGVGEGSVRLAEKLGLPASQLNPRNGGEPQDKVIYLIFPGTAKTPSWPLTEDEVQQAAMAAFSAWGGYERLTEAYPELRDEDDFLPDDGEITFA